MNENLKRVLGYTKRYWKPLTFSIVAASLYGLISAAPTYIIKQTIDEIFIKRYSHLIIPMIIAFLSFFFLKGVFMYLTVYYMHWVGHRVVNDLRSDLFAKIVHFPTSFFQKNTTGKLMSHFLNDIQMIQTVASNSIKEGVRSFFEAIFLLGFAFYQSWVLASLMLIVGPLIGIVIQRMGKARKIASRSIQIEMGNISTMLQESIMGIREIKAFNAEKTEQARFGVRLKKCFDSIMCNVYIESISPAFVETIAMAGCGVVFYVAAHQVLNGEITAGQLTAFVAAALLAYQPLKKILNLYSDVQYGLAAADRVFDLMDMIYPATQNRDVELKKFEHEIQWQNVSFAYHKDSPVMQNVNLTVQKGSCVGIIGPSGAGKSTLCDMLLGFLIPTEGTVYIDGKDITKISFTSLRGNIGYVGQHPFLFNDTILANISYSRPGATMDEVIDACKAAHAHEFIQKLSDGYNTMVGENGALLSGGQKQRLTIARALLKSPEILILDEATSALDMESEQMIKMAMDELRGSKTLFIVSHRPSMLENVDRILVVQDGHVKEISSQKYDVYKQSQFLV